MALCIAVRIRVLYIKLKTMPFIAGEDEQTTDTHSNTSHRRGFDEYPRAKSAVTNRLRAKLLNRPPQSRPQRSRSSRFADCFQITHAISHRRRHERRDGISANTPPPATNRSIRCGFFGNLQELARQKLDHLAHTFLRNTVGYCAICLRGSQ